MAYDTSLAERIQNILRVNNPPGLVEKKMFGGVGFMVRGNMACGVHKNSLIVRVGEERFFEALSKPMARPFDLTGKPMKGWVMVDPGGFDSQETLAAWVQAGVAFALCLPEK